MENFWAGLGKQLEAKRYMRELEIDKIHTEYAKKMLKQKSMQSAFRRFITFKGTGNGIRGYLGCDLSFIRGWIESMFTDKMNWGNYGSVWVIDHIVPIRVFNIFNESDLMLCWNYRNLMPILDEDNLKKQGNVFFSFELLFERKDKDNIYKGLFERIKPEVDWMVKYIDNYDKIK